MNTSPNPRQSPAVDIALATFNGERYLPDLLESIKQQTHNNWHIIAGDDGSTDQTAEILNAFSVDHPSRTTLLPVTKRLGAKGNFSRILQACRSEYVLPADQDDVWLPHKIERSLHLAQAIEKENPAGTPVLVHSDASVTDETLQILDPSLWHHQNLCPEYGLKFKNLLVQNVITGCTVLANRTLLNMALPISPESVMHDWWLGLTAAAFGKIGYLTEPSLLYRQHTGNQLGAKEWSPRYVATEAVSGIDVLKKRIHATQQQAASFKTRFAEQLGTNEQIVLDAYIRLSHCDPIRRRLLAAHHRFHKCGILRTAGFYTAL
jgi:glycosyltransferase involved in cell wall biosynthesis